MRLLTGKEAPRLANFRSNQEAGKIFARVILREGAHER
jgi:hypothetical protein